LIIVLRVVVTLLVTITGALAEERRVLLAIDVLAAEQSTGKITW